MPCLFSELSAKFLTWAAQCKKPSTVAVYRHYLRRFAEHLGDVAVSTIRPADLTAFAKSWHDVQAVKRLFRWAVEEAGLMASNPVARVRHPKKGTRRRIMTPAEMSALLRESAPDMRRLLLGYRETMARPGELRAAKWEDVRGEHPTRSVGDALTAGRASIILYEFKNADQRTEREAPRIILLNPRACRLLLWLYHRSPTKAGVIFLTARGRAWTPNAVRCRFRRLRKKLKIERDQRGETIVPYTFRHTQATLAAAAGIRDRVLADVLGHVETKTTARYQHLSVGHLRAALAPFWG